MKTYSDPQKEISTEDKFGRPDGSNKHSVTITDLSEGFKFKYKTYFFLVDEKGKFIQKVKSEKAGKELIHRCKAPWKVESYTEHEKLLRKRTIKNRFNYSGTHKFLDIHERRKALQVEYDLLEQRRMNVILNKKTRARNKRRIIKAGNLDINTENYETRDIINEILVENARKEMVNLL